MSSDVFVCSNSFFRGIETEDSYSSTLSYDISILGHKGTFKRRHTVHFEVVHKRYTVKIYMYVNVIMFALYYRNTEHS